ncbi:hypothetical protein [Streptomyces solicathayae]|uniref:Integral membrane protein n=1 Tax=Streptomyces solicathayae TaxID=3081768 RepID=A0ABZ0LP57_9ACTN|nr:hypothetical protein [Streptomyces sp. HUAS YS2]WOX21226.1 hypothetical protein R2D22_07435 [Streptomyces sp. HUAS YS2]
MAVVDSPEEVSLATQLLEGRGWSVRAWAAARDGEADALGNGRRGLMVEVRLYGARFGAVQAAVSSIEALARDHQAGMWVVDAGLIEHELSIDYRTVFHAFGRRRPATSESPEQPTLSARIFTWRTLLGMVTTVRVTKQPGRPSVETVAERLQRGVLTRHAYDPAALQLRIPMGMEGRDLDAPPPSPSAWRVVLPLMALLVVATACGFATTLVDGLWVLVPILMAGALVWPVGHQLTKRRENHPRVVQLAWGAMAVAPMAACGLLLALTAPGTPAEAARVMLYGAVGLVALVLIVYGLAYAFVHSWFSRNANWAVPALVPALAVSLPWFGGLLHTMYLRYGFGVPSDAIPVSVYWSYAASMKPVGIALALTLVLLAIAGWMRHYHQWIHAQGMVRVGVPFMSLFVVAMTLTAGLISAQVAASRAQAAAASGRHPAPYYGVQGALVCVKPMEKEISVFNGPLAPSRPLLTFGPSGDRVWLWDPKRDRALSVRLEDVVVTEARKGTCS